MTTILLVISVLVQGWGAVLALRLVPVARRRLPCILIAAAFTLRTISLFLRLWLGTFTPHPLVLAEESLALAVSALSVAGIFWIRPLLLEHRQSVEEQKRLLRELRQQGAAAEQERLRLHTLVENLPVGIFFIDPTGRILETNAMVDCIFRGTAPRSESIAEYRHYRGWWSDSGEPIAPDQWAAARAITRGETTICEMIDVERLDGTRGTLLNSAAPLRNAQGEITGGVVVILDVTEQRKAELDLRESEERFRSTFEQAAVGMLNACPSGRLLRVNDRFCEMVGYSKEELLGRTFSEITHPDDVAPGEELHRRLLDGEIPHYNREKRYLRKDGTPVCVNLTVSLMRDMEGKPRHSIAVVEDITARKALESELREAKEKAEEATRAKSEFLANMSHEIRTPMTVILGSLDHLAETAPRPEQRPLLEMAENAAERLLNLINDILDVSRIESRRLEISSEPFDLRRCVEKTLSIFDLKAREKGVDLRLGLSPDLPPLVCGDSDRIGQILLNLAGNALKFTEKGEVAVTVEPAPEGILFSVRDTGIGIPESKQGLLFESFSQVDPSRTRRYGGTGLGLAISKGLVELMGGTIRFESAEGKGSTFSFVLPLPPAPQGTDRMGRLPSAPSAAGEQLNILLAEDDPMVRDLMELILRRRPCNVQTAGTGAEALAAWKEGRFDLILMDVQMPGMDGLEATRIIRERESAVGSHTPVVALTAHARREDEEMCLRAGMDGFLSKPITIEQLHAAVERFAGKGRTPC